MNNTLDTNEITRYLSALVEKKGLPGAAVAVRGSEGFSYEAGFGYRDLGRSKVPDGNTIFGIASMGKSMAALSCAILAAEGKMSLEDPVSRYIPSFRVPGNPPDTVSVRDLAMHTAGIPPMEPLEWSIAMNSPGRQTEWALKLRESAPNQMDTIEQIIEYIAHCPYPTLGASGEYMSYSNEGYAILCYVVDAAAGMPLERFLKERVWDPLGMTRTTLDLDASQARKIASDGNLTALFELDENGVLVGDEDWSILPPFRACACVKSTAHDMARYYQCLSNGGILDGEQLLPAAAVELMIGASFPEQVKAQYCLGLNKRVENGHVICEHSGGLHGVSSEGGLFKGENYGFAVLTNQGEADAIDLMWALYNWVLGLPLDTPHRWLFPTREPFSEPQALLGSYLCNEGLPVTFRVYEKDGELYADKNEDTYRLVHCGKGWFLHYDKDGAVSGRSHFLIRDSLAWGVQVYTRIYRRVEEV